ncbi:hypothetical protein KIN20_000166 [Parelaphostrongylus tenuis]|uniref:Mitochondrial import receptor subunit TOM70 n=1 Tax=Parelaphostrongylus tenuis TaxID=148309 RepID=A0AAD5QFU8_PARTN|nr:hypothetical protein KIN20_000166 [Parelaphostrongylus tenuis]
MDNRHYFRTIPFASPLCLIMANSSRLYRYVGIAAIVGVSAAGLYYIIWRRRNSRKKGPTAKELKDLGNKLFAAKKYSDSIRIFSKAINAPGSDSETLMAMCFQNRAAAKEHHGGYSVDDMLNDCQQALKHNPRYAKAHFRKARLLEMKKDYMASLTCVYCAIQLDPTLGSKKHVRHEKVYNWLRKTVTSDCIRHDVFARDASGCSPYDAAIVMVRRKHYDDVADIAVQEDGEHLLKALILAGRFYLYQNRLDLFSSCLQKFELLFNELPETKRTEKQELLDAKYILCLEAARTPEDIKKAFTNAVENADRTNADFYVMAAFRFVLCNEIRAALDVLATDGIYSDNMKLLQLALLILTDSTPDGRVYDMALLHRDIFHLENFVAKLQPTTAYALSLLARITATFGSAAGARLISEDVLVLEPDESIHYFDRSCVAESPEDAVHYLEKCMAIEPYHAEANYMYASMLMNEIGPRELTNDEYAKIEKHLSMAMSTFDENVDFPVLMGVFRLREVLTAKKEASKILVT